jgi:hypothetical protein
MQVLVLNCVGIVTTLAGPNFNLRSDGFKSNAAFNGPGATAFDPVMRQLYVVEAAYVRRVDVDTGE